MADPDIWTFYERLSDGDRARLTPRRRGLVAICDLRQEVNSGGFDSYFSYWGGNTASEALALLPTALGEEWAVLLREAMGRLGATYPTSENERTEIMDDLEGGAFEDLDDRFFALEAASQADARLSAMLDD